MVSEKSPIITLNPKKESVLQGFSFCLISYVRSVYKVIINVLFFRLGEGLRDTNSIIQSAFVAGTKILDSSPLCIEVVEEMTRKSKSITFYLPFKIGYL